MRRKLDEISDFWECRSLIHIDVHSVFPLEVLRDQADIVDRDLSILRHTELLEIVTYEAFALRLDIGAVEAVEVEEEREIDILFGKVKLDVIDLSLVVRMPDT